MAAAAAVAAIFSRSLTYRPPRLLSLILPHSVPLSQFSSSLPSTAIFFLLLFNLHFFLRLPQPKNFSSSITSSPSKNIYPKPQALFRDYDTSFPTYSNHLLFYPIPIQLEGLDSILYHFLFKPDSFCCSVDLEFKISLRSDPISWIPVLIISNLLSTSSPSYPGLCETLNLPLFSESPLIMKFLHIAILCVSCAVIKAQPHNHFHHHQARSVVPNRVHVVTSSVTVQAAVVTVYELNGQKISYNDVDSCLKKSSCVIVGTKVTSASSLNAAGQPIAPTQPPKLSSSPTQSSLKIPSTSAASTTVKTTASLNDNVVDQHQSNVLAAVNSEFPSGKIDCSEFPSAYGAVAADWVGLGGWTGVQKTPGYSASSKAISYIETAVAGDGCTPGSFCSYSCPAGYQKSQWPAAQGLSGQSIGGLYCNTNGKLELSRSSSKQICTPGVSNIQIKNLLNKNVAICRTDYPGTEAETVALNALPASTVKVTCPDSKDYYRTWEGAPTSAQYYINPSGNDVEEACTWGSAGSNLGNWAPVNMGVGKADSGTTFVSLFPNVPTNPNGVLDFNIDVTGDVNGRCSYKNGKYYKDGVISPTGCTVGVNGKAVFIFS